MKLTMQTYYRSLLLSWVAVAILPVAFASDAGNPFLRMIGKPYVAYMRDLQDLRYAMDYTMNRTQADSIVRYMQEAMVAAGNKRWGFEGRFLMSGYRFRHEKTITIEEVGQEYKNIYQEAMAVQDTVIALRSKYALMGVYWYFTKQYEEAFDLAKQLGREMERTSMGVVPEKLYCFRMIADMYYKFQDYDEAKVFYNKVLQEPEPAAEHHLLGSCYNGLALIARYHDKNLDASDQYLLRILEMPRHPTATETHTQSWKAIANGNIGYNLYLRKRYAEALPKLEFARKQMADLNDLTYAGYMAATLADAHLALGNKSVCKKYIDITEGYNAQLEPYLGHTNLYPVLSRYYLSKGNSRLGQQYMDSATAVQKRSVEEFSMMKLMRAEQRNHKLEQEAKEEQLKVEQQRAERYRLLVKGIVGGLSVLFIAACGWGVLRFRKRRTQQVPELADLEDSLLSQSNESPDKSIANGEEDPQGRYAELAKEIEQLMISKKLYLKSDFRMVELARDLRTNRTYISRTISEEFGCSFSSYINRLRVEHAQLLIHLHPDMPQDQIAENSGFKHAAVFSRTFKEYTGVTFREWQRGRREP